MGLENSRKINKRRMQHTRLTPDLHSSILCKQIKCSMLTSIRVSLLGPGGGFAAAWHRSPGRGLDAPELSRRSGWRDLPWRLRSTGRHLRNTGWECVAQPQGGHEMGLGTLNAVHPPTPAPHPICRHKHKHTFMSYHIINNKSITKYL